MNLPLPHRRDCTIVGKTLLGAAAIIALTMPMAWTQEPATEKKDFFKDNFVQDTKPAAQAPDAAAAVDEAAQPAPDMVAPKKYTLEESIALGMTLQPALAAAQASLNAAIAGQRGINRLGIAAGLVTPDLPIRKQQSCLGVRIAEAGVSQAEWEARYAITRNYYSVIYARAQSRIVTDLVDKLDRAAKTADDIIKAGDPKAMVNVIDRDTLIINRELYKARGQEAYIGVERAMAALREAIGLGCNEPFDVADATLPALVENLDKEQFISMALAMRGEMAQVIAADQVVALEIQAQQRIFGPQAKTFAIGADIHAKPVPQGDANGQYKPSALGLEMPATVAGPKSERVARIAALKDRADAVVNKTENLIRLEVEANYLKWKEAANRVKILEKMPVLAQKIAANVTTRFNDGKATGEELIRARTLADQANASFVEALYNHALGLAALERITAGGYRIAPRQP